MDELGELPTLRRADEETTKTKRTETLLRDSMVTVRLSEPELEGPVDAISAQTGEKQHNEDNANETKIGGAEEEETLIEEEEGDSDEATIYEAQIARMEVPRVREDESRHASDSEGEGVNWEGLERTEDQEPRDKDTEDVCFPTTAYEPHS